MRKNHLKSFTQIISVTKQQVFRALLPRSDGYGVLNVTDRLLLKAMQKAVAKKDPALYTCADKTVVEASKGKCDWTDKKYLTPVINFIG